VQPRVGYDSAWLREFLRRGCGIGFDETQAAEIAALAERKLVDLFDVAEAAAVANGRAQILRHDLPLTTSPSQATSAPRNSWSDWKAGRILNLTL
jgi:hypothetical protein